MIEDGLKPRDPEIIAAEKICQTMREIAKKLPTPERGGQESYVQFGNNFYFLFWDIGEEKTDPDSITVKKLQQAEELYGDKWRKFLEENQSLIQKISSNIKKQKLYRELRSGFMQLYRDEKTRDMGGNIGEELNLQDIGKGLWSELNPLLEQASEKMRSYGMNPEDFYI